MKHIRGAIFDFDGTLLDSMWAWTDIASRYLKEQGITPRDDIDARVFRMSLTDAACLIRREYGLAQDADEIRSAMNRLIENMYYSTFELKPGVRELLEELSKRHVRICMATASDRCIVEPALRRTGILEYFDFIFTCSELHADKNDPYIYRYVRSYMETPVQETLVFEDAFHAIKAAKSAGFPVAAVYDATEEANQSEIRRIADYYLKTPAEWPTVIKGKQTSDYVYSPVLYHQAHLS